MTFQDTSRRLCRQARHPALFLTLPAGVLDNYKNISMHYSFYMLFLSEKKLSKGAKPIYGRKKKLIRRNSKKSNKENIKKGQNLIIA